MECRSSCSIVGDEAVLLVMHEEQERAVVIVQGSAVIFQKLCLVLRELLDCSVSFKLILAFAGRCERKIGRVLVKGPVSARICRGGDLIKTGSVVCQRTVHIHTAFAGGVGMNVRVIGRGRKTSAEVVAVGGVWRELRVGGYVRGDADRRIGGDHANVGTVVFRRIDRGVQRGSRIIGIPADKVITKHRSRGKCDCFTVSHRRRRRADRDITAARLFRHRNGTHRVIASGCIAIGDGFGSGCYPSLFICGIPPDSVGTS